MVNGNQDVRTRSVKMRDPIYEMEEELWRLANLKDGEECGHPGCLSHVTHPCEKCGRVAGKRLVPDKNT